MEISLGDLKNYFISTTVISIFVLIIITYSDAALTVACESGGPYAKNATINVVGNVTDGGGLLANVSVNISSSGIQRVSLNTTSDNDGKYNPSIASSLDYDSYNVVVEARGNGSIAYCTDTFDVKSVLNTSCTNRVLSIEGQALFTSDLTPVSNGRATVGIVEERIANSSALNSTGGFRVPIYLCVKKGVRYTFDVMVDDGKDKRGFLQQVFVAL